MFAGLPGIGVGTLFYVLVALWMPIRETGRLLRGDFDAARWRLVVMQVCFAITIIASVAIADRVLGMILADGSITAINPARVINEGFAEQAPQSIWAAPIMASLILLAGVVTLTEICRIAVRFGQRPRPEPLPAPRYPDERAA
jgi:hypothetical protein